MLALFLIQLWSSPTDPSVFARHAHQSLEEGRPLNRVFVGDLAAARQAREALLEEMRPTHGEVIGYKAALTSEAARKRFGADTPLLGVLLAGMLRSEIDPVPDGLGAIPVIEADLVVRVGDPALIRAETREQALAGLDAVIPFLEVPDMTYAPGLALTPEALIAINVGARVGVLGEPIPLTDGEDWITRLGELRVTLAVAGHGLIRGSGEALLGHPLDAVLWLVSALRAEGRPLLHGQLLSLGSLTAPFPLGDTKRVVLRYDGLRPDRPVSILVDFEERTP